MQGRSPSHRAVVALRAYQAAVEGVATREDAAPLVEGGFAVRAVKAAPAAPARAPFVYVGPGPRPGEAVARWPVARTANRDAIAAELLAAVGRVCDTGWSALPADPSSPAWAALVALDAATTVAKATLARRAPLVAGRGARGRELRGKITKVLAALRDYDEALAAEQLAADAA